MGGFFVSVFWEWMKTWFDLSIKNAKAPNEVEEILSGSQKKAFLLVGFFVSVFLEWMKTWFDLSIKNAKALNEVEEILSGSRVKELYVNNKIIRIDIQLH